MHIIYILTISLFNLFQRFVDADKYGGLQQSVARLMHTTLSVSYTQGRREQIIPLLSLTCHLVLYGCFRMNH